MVNVCGHEKIHVRYEVLQWCCWTSKGSGIWWCIVGWVISSVANDHRSFILKWLAARENPS
jgi:hypothetical protein